MDDWKKMRGLLKTAMAKQEMTQAELARRSGISQPQISRALNGVRPPTKLTVVSMARAVGIEVEFSDDAIEAKAGMQRALKILNVLEAEVETLRSAGVAVIERLRAIEDGARQARHELAGYIAATRRKR